MAARRRTTKTNTPLDDRQRKLHEEQAKLDELAAKLNRVIEEAPKIKAERARIQREELMADRRMRGGVHRLNSHTIADTRFDQFGNRGHYRRRPLKAERRQTFLMFCALVIGLGILVFWLLSVWHLEWPR
jgi:septal ring factor EnvC (AmiA/AmiB activator)